MVVYHQNSIADVELEESVPSFWSLPTQRSISSRQFWAKISFSWCWNGREETAVQRIKRRKRSSHKRHVRDFVVRRCISLPGNNLVVTSYQGEHIAVSLPCAFNCRGWLMPDSWLMTRPVESHSWARENIIVGPFPPFCMSWDRDAEGVERELT